MTGSSAASFSLKWFIGFICIFAIMYATYTMVWMKSKQNGDPISNAPTMCNTNALSRNFETGSTKLCLRPPVLVGMYRKNQHAEHWRQSLNSLKSDLHRMFDAVEDGAKLCPDVEHIGNAGYGGYDICMTPGFRPETGKCLVYSFGIGNNWSFDEHLSKGRFSCEVHSFDPSIGLKDHKHSANVSFHNLGLWGNDIENHCDNDWQFAKLSTIRRRLGHEKRVIDVLKVDAESAEWPFLRNVVYEEPEQLETIRQVIFEFHTPTFQPKVFDKPEVLEVTDYIKTFTTDRGFVTYRSKRTEYCCLVFSPMMPPNVTEKCCYEQYYLNRKFIRNS